MSALEKLRRRIDALSLRERALLGAAVAVVMVLTVDLMLIEPTQRTLDSERATLATLSREVAELRGQVEGLREQVKIDPNAEARRQLEAMRAEIAETDAELENNLVQLVSPEDMARLLQDLIKANPGLKLLRMESQAAVPAWEFLSDSEQPPGEKPRSTGDGEQPTPVPALYKHGLSIELSGDYLSTLRYLEAVEALPWRVFWDRLELRTEEYPRTRILLRVYTLSLQEGWIGV